MSVHRQLRDEPDARGRRIQAHSGRILTDLCPPSDFLPEKSDLEPRYCGGTKAVEGARRAAGAGEERRRAPRHPLLQLLRSARILKDGRELEPEGMTSGSSLSDRSDAIDSSMHCTACSSSLSSLKKGKNGLLITPGDSYNLAARYYYMTSSSTKSHCHLICLPPSFPLHLDPRRRAPTGSTPQR
jgi:hypothetical protein